MTQTRRKGQLGEGSLHSPRSGAAVSGQPSPAYQDAKPMLRGSSLYGHCGTQPLPSISHPIALISPNLRAVRLGRSAGEASKAEQGAQAVPSQRLPQHPSPLQQRHQKHLKIAPEARASCQLSCCPLPAPPRRCCAAAAPCSLAGGAAGTGSVRRSPCRQRLPRNGSHFPALRDGGDRWSMGLRSPHRFVRSQRRAGGRAHVTAGCPQQEGDTALPVRWETPAIGIFQPGATSCFFAEIWREKPWGGGPRARLPAVPPPPALAGKSVPRMLQCWPEGESPAWQKCAEPENALMRRCIH